MFRLELIFGLSRFYAPQSCHSTKTCQQHPPGRRQRYGRWCRITWVDRNATDIYPRDGQPRLIRAVIPIGHTELQFIAASRGNRKHRFYPTSGPAAHGKARTGIAAKCRPIGCIIGDVHCGWGQGCFGGWHCKAWHGTATGCCSCGEQQCSLSIRRIQYARPSVICKA